MNLKNLAQLFPDDYRREILELNMISKAQAIASNTEMQYLFNLWKNYVEPNIQATCNMCFQRVLDNFRGMQSVFVELEKEKQLLDGA